MRLRPGNLFTTEVDGETVVLDADNSVYLSVNAVGGLLIPLLRAGASVEDLALTLVDKFGLDTGRATSDCQAFVRQLRDHGLIVE